MTLCIAAACHDGGKDRIVVATDWRAEGTVAGGDIQDKLKWIGNDAVALLAGSVTRALELRDSISDSIAQRNVAGIPWPTPERLSDYFRVPVVQFKRKLVDEYAGLKFGMTYPEFLRCIGESQIPQAVAIEAIGDIRNLHQDCCLILCMFDSKKVARIIKIDDDGSLEMVDSFATIGSGSNIAEGALYQREQNDRTTLSATLYNVFEATRLGSIAPGVGGEFTFDVLYPPDRLHKHMWMQFLNPKGEAFMESQFRKRGPKAYKKFARLPSGIFEDDS